MIGKKILSYEIKSLLGEGGMGNVYLAEHVITGQKVAIKSLLPQLVRHEHIRERFKKEAETMSLLVHPNIVKLIAYKEDTEGAYIIMEYVEGKELDKYIKTTSGPMTKEMALSVMKQLLDAFSFAHQHGVIHRDIKPSNIIFTADGHIKIMDFGIAKILSDADKKLTKTGLQMGTVYYMSPEQVKGKNVDQRSDIYSLGVTLFQMLTGRSPYESFTTEYEVYGMIVKDPLPSISTIYPGGFLPFDTVIEKATAKEPGDRFSNCTEFSEALIDSANSETQPGGDGDENAGNSLPGVEYAESSGPVKKNTFKRVVFLSLGLCVLVLLGWQCTTYFKYKDLVSQANDRFSSNDFSEAKNLYERAREKGESLIAGQSDETITTRIEDCKFELYKKDGQDQLRTDSFSLSTSPDHTLTALASFNEAKKIKEDDTEIAKKIALCEKINMAMNNGMDSMRISPIDSYDEAIAYARQINEEQVVIDHLEAAKRTITPKVTLVRSWVEKGVTAYGKNGLKVHFNLFVYNLENKECQLAVNFFDKDDGRMQAKSSSYETADGYLANHTIFTPSNNSFYISTAVFLPYSELAYASIVYTYKYSAGLFVNHKQIGGLITEGDFTW